MNRPAAPLPAGELAIKCSAEELRPFALPALERLAQILQARGAALCTAGLAPHAFCTGC